MISVFKNFLIWLIVFLLGFGVYSVSQARIHASKNVKKSLSWYPTYSEGLLNLNDRILANGLKNAQFDKVRRQSIKALSKAPLSFKPFLQLAEASVLQNSIAESRVLFSEAHRRNIRNRRTLRSLVNIDASTGQYPEAIKNLTILLSLKGEKVQLDDYHQALLVFSNIQPALTEINSYLIDRPIWAKRYLDSRIAQITEKNFADIGQSIQMYSGNEFLERDKDLHTDYLAALYKIRKIDEAFEYWYNLIEEPKPDLNYTVFNPKFERRKALPPFNWLEVDGAKYFSEIDQGNGLYVSYADPATRLMTEQVIKLDPGGLYRFNVEAEWSYRQRQGMFFWNIRCLSNELVISELYLNDQAQKARGGESNFDVPLEGCKKQILSLFAKPGQYSQRIWSITTSLNLVRVE